ncbi:integrase arm-type DNA-binding domain-containing protein [Bradyrhizobium sp. AUGA SZCCT0274]|uniref:tyrosine-type recombinase/integrase n=1 Tax=Bradyrhizobium sp. AUGA SZCCT0274 TaxID=2807670 RepID=UPI001BAA4906|nr:integrase arm-type DNA-binding domain-containing protein [Bradyrhizobium sp. AUGA SZCCT0274]MBR1241509.1 integrase arm-type DNA-binding domain-containing protein [Bradyrhizobium sp. AUGA SZCCT0274]
MPVRELTEKELRELLKNPPSPRKQIDYFDDVTKSGTKGLFIKHSFGGTMTWYLMYYKRGGKSKTHKLGRYPSLKLAEARIKAQRLQVALHDDRDHFEKLKLAEIEAEAKRLTFAVVVEKFKKLYIEKNKLRTARVMVQQIEKHLMPTFGDREFKSISRSEISNRLDEIEENHGPAMADSVLAVYRSIASFHEARDDNYSSPIVKRMRRSKPNPRKRVLNEAEIKAFWTATEKLGTYGALARVCLLTGQRKTKVVSMKWTDIKAGVWTLGHEEREKPNCGVIKLAPSVLALIESQPRLEGNPYVFPAMHKRRAFNAFGQNAVLLTTAEREVLPDIPEHTLHDLRRTFRSLCPKVGVQREIAERCLGHTIGNAVERTYDQYPYLDEMTAAFATVARHIQDIVTPPPSNVVSLRRGRSTERRARAPSSRAP